MNFFGAKTGKLQTWMTRRLAILLAILGAQILFIAVTNATASEPQLQTTYTCASSDQVRFSDSEGNNIARNAGGLIVTKRAPHMNQNLVIGENEFLLRPFIFSDQSGRKTLEIYQRSPEYGFSKIDDLNMGAHEAQEAQLSMMATEVNGGRQMVFCLVMMEWL